MSVALQDQINIMGNGVPGSLTSILVFPTTLEFVAKSQQCDITRPNLTIFFFLEHFPNNFIEYTWIEFILRSSLSVVTVS